MSSTTTKKQFIRIAIIGCGRISKNHINAISSHSELAKIVALVDENAESLSVAQQLVFSAAAENGSSLATIKAFSSYTEFLSAVASNLIEVDLVVLCTPSGLHSSQAIQAAKLGLDVCTEKPMATKYSDAREMIKVCDQHNTKLFVVKQNRFNSTLQLVRNQINRGRFGRINLVAVNVFWQRPQEYYDSAPWRGTWELDGGALMNQASHYIDLIEWMVGPVQTVQALTSTLSRVIEVEDTAVLNLRWRHGALGSMSVTMLAYPKNLEGSITILGDKGSVKIGGPAVNNIDTWLFEDSHPDDQLVEDSSYKTTSVYGHGHGPYYKNIFDCLLNGAPAECDGREGLKSIELLTAAYRSSRDNIAVSLPLDI